MIHTYNDLVGTTIFVWTLVGFAIACLIYELDKLETLEIEAYNDYW